MLKKVARTLLTKDEHGDSILSVLATGAVMLLLILAAAALCLTAR